MSEVFAECKATIDGLIAVFDDLDAYVEQNELLDEQVMQNLHLKRQQLTAQLHKVMPTPLPPALEQLVLCLHEKTKSALTLMTTTQQETRDAVLKLQNYRKAKNVYQSFNTGS